MIKARKYTVIIFAIVTTLLGLSSTSYARDIAQGTIEIGGDLDLSIDSTEYTFNGGGELNTDTTNISADAVYYVAPNIGLGLGWVYEYVEANSFGEKAESTTNVIGPEVKFNISLNKNTSFSHFGMFALAETGITDSTGKITTDGFG